ncbi:Protein CBG05450 [Caenorhabditis briggsae]|uniref:Protein CBG05450 n=1 Tax=Caenorhabditis briggsae TaxID=6238 RepID=E3CTY2_CAEBR|nr:Protein CBG05450 [Caenorhabditis briggsae]CBX33025.1 Protein CBG05450 [Caenorhabditis briggsae]
MRDYIAKADDIRTKLLDSMLRRLEMKKKQVLEQSWEICDWRMYVHWLLIAAILIVFCVLRYGVEKVHLQPTEGRDGDPIVEYKDRQLEKTSEAFRARHRQ